MFSENQNSAAPRVELELPDGPENGFNPQPGNRAQPENGAPAASEKTPNEAQAQSEKSPSSAESFLINPEIAERRGILKRLFGDYSAARLQKVIKILQEFATAKAKAEAEQERRRSVKQAKMIKAVTALK